MVALVERMHKDFQDLVDLVTGPDAVKHSAAQMELRIFREMLAMGRRLLALFFYERAAAKPAVPTGADGRPLEECHLRNTTYLSVFGKIRFKRHRFYGQGQPGVSPLDPDEQARSRGDDHLHRRPPHPQRALNGRRAASGAERGSRRGASSGPARTGRQGDSSRPPR